MMPAATLVVDLVRPATDFVNIIAGPTFSVVPPGIAAGAAVLTPGPGFVASGGYVLTGKTDTALELTANTHYWAGTPAVTTIDLVTDLGGKSPVDAFSAGDLDYTPVSPIDATWLAYDETLGPQLRARRIAVDRVLRVRHDQAAVRRARRPEGVRRGDRLAADGRPER